MSYLLFMDESGHDGSGAYEVRGGIALPARNVWQFTRRMRGLEARCFGDLLSNHGSELKAIKLFERRKLRLARRQSNFPDYARQQLCRTYLGQGRNNTEPTLEMAVAYAQAGYWFATRLLDLVHGEGGRVFASVVPSNFSKPPAGISPKFVRKDLCGLFERFYYFLEEQDETGVLVMDETHRTADKRFLSRLERYFSTHEAGKQHAKLIIPTTLFTGSDMSYPVQAADIVIYLIAHGLRLPGMIAPARNDFKSNWVSKVEELQYTTVRTWYGKPTERSSIFYVPNPWGRGS